jgi:hypothetical protein
MTSLAGFEVSPACCRGRPPDLAAVYTRASEQYGITWLDG